MLKEAFFAVAASREPKMDRVRPAMLIAALVVDVAPLIEDYYCTTRVFLRVSILLESVWSVYYSLVPYQASQYVNTLQCLNALSRGHSGSPIKRDTAV